MYGDLEAAGDLWRLRFRRQLPHPPERVWRAITEPEHLQAWFPQRIVGRWQVGGMLRFEGEGGSFEGEVLRYQPETLLEFRWGGDIIRLEVTPHGGGTALTLLDTFAAVGKAARDGAGWHACLDTLAFELDGLSAPWESPHQRWAAVHPGYVEKFGPAAATLGPPA
jgi:uncharacterized protein YndB with AHSA1/START domain